MYVLYKIHQESIYVVKFCWIIEVTILRGLLTLYVQELESLFLVIRIFCLVAMCVGFDYCILSDQSILSDTSCLSCKNSTTKKREKYVDAARYNFDKKRLL